MLALEQVSVMNDLKGTEECRNIQAKIMISVVKAPSSVSVVKISLKCSTTRSAGT